MRVRYSKQAEIDLETITEFGVERWGEDQAVRYATGLLDHVAEFARRPHRHAIVEGLQLSVRSVKHVSHRIFYAVGDDAIVVLRILHASQEMARHLP